MKTQNLKRKVKLVWRIWANALGSKAGKCDKESDAVALIRTFIVIQAIVTNGFIIANVIIHLPKEQVPTIQKIQVIPYSYEIQ